MEHGFPEILGRQRICSGITSFVKQVLQKMCVIVCRCGKETVPEGEVIRFTNSGPQNGGCLACGGKTAK